jgi:oligoribonuclease (3'-5' exoribonuclease)
MHGLGSEQDHIIAVFCLCTDKPLNCISSDKFYQYIKNSESLMHESFLFKY